MRPSPTSTIAALLLSVSSVALAGCVTPKARFVDAERDAALRASPLDPSVLEPTARAAFERDQIWIEPIPHASSLYLGAPGPSYVLRTASGPMTENEFARRYRELTGSRVLADVNHPRRALGPLVALFAATAAGAVALTVWIAGGGLANPGPEGGGAMGIVFGYASVPGTGALLVEGLVHEDGTPVEHELTERDAQVYVERYDHALYAKLGRWNPIAPAPLAPGLSPAGASPGP